MIHLIKKIGLVVVICCLPIVLSAKDLDLSKYKQLCTNYIEKGFAKSPELKSSLAELAKLLGKEVKSDKIQAVKVACEATLSLAMQNKNDYNSLIERLKELQEMLNGIPAETLIITGASQKVDTVPKQTAKKEPTESDLKKVLPDSSKTINDLGDKLADEQSTSKMYKIFTLLFALLTAVGTYLTIRFRNLWAKEGKERQSLKAQLEAIVLEQKNAINKAQSTAYPDPEPEVNNTRNTPTTVNEWVVSPKPQEPVLQPFYFSTPEEDGSFKDSSRSEQYRSTASMYKFMPETPTRATFSFINDASTLHDALNRPDIYLLPVCKPENDRNTKAASIETKVPGIAQLEGDKWVVKQLAVIRYA